MAQILSDPQYRNNQGYNGFPLRSSIQFSSALGQLLPVWFHLLDPGDRVKCKTTLTTRTQPLDSAAMVTINEHLEWFFVPMTNLYKMFEDVFYGINDVHSTLVTPKNLMAHRYPKYDNFDLLRYFYEYTSRRDVDATLQYTDDAGFDLAAGSYRLLQALGRGIDPFMDNQMQVDSTFINPSQDFWSLLAYQAIYFSHYRLDQWVLNDPQAYNVDDLYNGSAFNYNRFQKILQLRYRPLRKDYFHNFVPSPLFGAESINHIGDDDSELSSVLYPGSSGKLNDWLSLYFLNTSRVDTIDTEYGLPALDNELSYNLDFPSSVYTDVNLGSFSPSAIRGSFAYEKLLEITRRAGKHVDAQTLAHFGIKVPEGVSNEPLYLGSHDSKVVIGDVISTSATDSAPLGEIAGKGYNQSSHFDCQFEAKVHGVLMCIHSSDVEMHYSPTIIDQQNLKVTPESFYHPEYDDLGMVPMFNYQGTLDYMSSHNFDIYGWNYRYWDSKIKYNRTFGSMYKGMNHWTIQRNGIRMFTQENSFRSYASPYQNNIVTPDLLNDVMLQSYHSELWQWEDTDNIPEGEPAPMVDPSLNPTTRQGAIAPVNGFYQEIFGSDPFIHDLFVDVDYVSKKSTYGLPNL